MIKVAIPIIGEEEIEAVTRVLRSGNYVCGAEVAQFEKDFASYIGCADAVAVSTGVAALHAALMAAGVGPGDEVIVPSMSFFATASAVMHQNAVPVFADVDENYCLDPDSFEQQITPSTKAVIPVHFYGYVANMDRINAIARKRGIVVIEDCAQAIGGSLNGVKTGLLGDMGAFSFYATKQMTTGEGGLITTNNREWAAKMRLFRNHGMGDAHTHVMLGYNYRMTEMEAAIGRIQLAKLDEMNATRIRHSEYLGRGLAGINWLHYAPARTGSVHTYFWFPLFYNSVKAGRPVGDFLKHLDTHGIGYRFRYKVPLYRQPLLMDAQRPCMLECPHYQKHADYANVHFKNAEKFSGHMIGLPNHAGLTSAELDEVIRVVQSFSQ